jgi:hypothetical protein
MTNNKIKYFFCALAALSSMPAFAYDLKTHARLTSLSFDRSRLATDSTLFPSLGINVEQAKKLSLTYLDLPAAALPPIERDVYQYEVDKGIDNDTRFNIRAWLQRGAIREDDAGGLLRFAEPNPDDEPGGNFNRFCNHFFDPYRGRALSVGGISSAFCPNTGVNGNRAANEWANSPYKGWKALVQQSVQYRNHFTIVHARELMWRALTLTKLDQSGSGYTSIEPVGTAKEKEAKRLQYWASTFKALGNVVHLVQDAAQPQHARNEDHPVGGPKAYEKYIESRMGVQQLGTWRNPFTNADQLVTIPALDIGNYPVPELRDFNSYWTTGGNIIADGRGMSDYSNRGFLTPQNSLGNTEYPSPDPNVQTYVTRDEVRSNDPTTCDFNAGTILGSFRYLLGDIKDSANPGQTQKIRMASTGLMDQYLQTRSATVRSYSFNKCTMDDRAALLLPRAASYSAGIINHFFRGKMEIKLPPDGVYAIIDHIDPVSNCKDNCGFKRVKAKVKNITPPIVESGTGTSYPQDMVNGEMVAIAKFHRNTCYLPDLSGEYVQFVGTYTSSGDATTSITNRWRECRNPVEEIVVSKPTSNINLAAGAENSFTFDFDKAIPINATDLYLQIVYRGKLGDEEDALAAQTLDISEPNYITFASPAGAPLKFGGAGLAVCVPFVEEPAVNGNGKNNYCRVAYITGTSPYSSDLSTRGRGNWCFGRGRSGFWKPALLQIDEVTGEYSDAEWGTRITNQYPYSLDISYLQNPHPNPRTQVATCVDPSDNSVIGSYIVMTGLFIEWYSGTGGILHWPPYLEPNININLPPVKVQSISF